MRIIRINIDLDLPSLASLNASKLLLNEDIQRALSLLKRSLHHNLLLVNASVDVDVHRFLWLVALIVFFFDYAAELVNVFACLVNSRVYLLNSQLEASALLDASSNLETVAIVRAVLR